MVTDQVEYNRIEEKSYKIIQGNVGNGYFHFIEVSEPAITGFVNAILILIGVDCISLAFSTILLKLTCNINTFQVNIHLDLTKEHVLGLLSPTARVWAYSGGPTGKCEKCAPKSLVGPLMEILGLR